jgi:hypothetical protein
VILKYRKKPVVIEAWQYTEEGGLGPGVCFGERNMACNTIGAIKTRLRPHIHTLEGELNVFIGDYIITGIKGEHYPCKPDIFETTYEVVE